MGESFNTRSLHMLQEKINNELQVEFKVTFFQFLCGLSLCLVALSSDQKHNTCSYLSLELPSRFDVNRLSMAASDWLAWLIR